MPKNPCPSNPEAPQVRSFLTTPARGVQALRLAFLAPIIALAASTAWLGPFQITPPAFSQPVPARAAFSPTNRHIPVNPMPPLAPVSHLTAAERHNILHLYYSGPKVRLTFDDCATPTRLSRTLGWLKAHNIQAVFFFTGQCMLAHPGYRSQMITSGQLLGNHSYDHADYSRMTDPAIRNEIRRPGSVIPTTVPKLCRPPYGAGAFSIRVYNALAAAGCRPAFWTVDTRDWDGSSAATIIERVKYGDATTPRVYAGGVILMHGTGVHTLEALAGIRSALLYHHYSAVTIH